MKVGPYELLEQVGSGALGTVWKARHGLTGDTLYAVKVISPNLSARPDFAARFWKQTEALHHLCDPRIVPLRDYGKDGASYYLVHDFETAQSLSSILEHGKMSAEQAVGLTIEVCRAVERAASLGVSHGNLKPENIFVPPQGGVRIVDFGFGQSGDLEAAMRLLEAMTDKARAPEWLTRVMTERFLSIAALREALERRGQAPPIPEERPEVVRSSARRTWKIYRKWAIVLALIALSAIVIALARARRAEIMSRGTGGFLPVRDVAPGSTGYPRAYSVSTISCAQVPFPDHECT